VLKAPFYRQRELHGPFRLDTEPGGNF